MRNLIMVLMLAGATGCATMSEHDCAGADWYSFGYQDGNSGRGYELANQRSAACTRHGFPMDHATYQQGREAGLASYCTPTRAYQNGVNGAGYSGQCVAHNERDYLPEYELGRELNQLNANLQRWDREVQRLDYASRELASEIDGRNNRIRDVSLNLTQQEINQLLDENDESQRDRDQILVNELPEARDALEWARKELDAYRSSIDERRDRLAADREARGVN